MITGGFIILAFAVLDWIAVAKGWRKVELVMKPLTLLALFIFLLIVMLVDGFQSIPPLFFAAGLLLSLLGDILLLFSERWFLWGLGAFLLAHVAYIIGFNVPLPDVPLLWSVGIAIMLALTASRLLRRIVVSMRKKGFRKLTTPVILYAVTITIMLLSALLTFFRLDWNALAALLAALGAALFFFSDVVLAWYRFVDRFKHSRLLNMILYHLGQMLLIGGVMLQFLF